MLGTIQYNKDFSTSRERVFSSCQQRVAAPERVWEVTFAFHIETKAIFLHNYSSMDM